MKTVLKDPSPSFYNIVYIWMHYLLLAIELNINSNEYLTKDEFYVALKLIAYE